MYYCYDTYTYEYDGTEYEYCDTWCQPHGGNLVAQVEDWGTWQKCEWENVEYYREYETPAHHTCSENDEYCCEFPETYTYTDYYGDEVTYEYCDTYCQPHGGHFEEVTEDWGTYTTCVWSDGCEYDYPDYDDYCDTWCVPTGGFFEYNSDYDYSYCSWSDGVDEYAYCLYPYSFSWGDYCDSWCQPHDGHFVEITTDWGTYEECQWDNVVAYSSTV